MLLCRRLENLESEMVYTIRGKHSVYRTSRVGVFFLQKVSHAEESLAINRSSPLGEIRRLEHLEGKMVYTTRGKCSVY